MYGTFRFIVMKNIFPRACKAITSRYPLLNTSYKVFEKVSMPLDMRYLFLSCMSFSSRKSINTPSRKRTSYLPKLLP